MEVKTKTNTEAPKGNDTATKVTCPGKPTATMEPIVQDDEARARKGKMKENVLTVCLVNESDALRDKTLSARGVEDGSTLGATDEESTTANGTRIIVGWNPRVFDVQCMQCTKQWITCRVTSAQHSLDVIVSFIYGLNTPAEREEVWDYIGMQVGWSQSIPWVLLGDFNATMNITDSIGGNTQWNRHKQAFGDCLHNAELHPLPYRGIKYTWTNGQDEGGLIMKKLDWIISNAVFARKWPDAQAQFMPKTVSDHSPMLLHIKHAHYQPNRCFKFLNLWAEREDFLPHIASIWQGLVNGSPMFRLSTKLQWAKTSLANRHKYHSNPYCRRGPTG
ncbi:hypothetical protein OIU74_021554 [Salix koriyanagi]|uniref:Endonuclease/exonuclease/phosphatase domain-containing protein n=1 Tax=Salix koriyanagi TaxID=2511006 RepID=A0A9Q0WKR8_9ROSI|nr:hypothetical protein OIU74_021554 [Salix koriyanagi]